MYGINRQPLIDLDERIDVERFSRLKDEMDAGIAKSHWEAGSFGPGVYEKQVDRDLFNLEEVLLPGGKHPDAPHVMQVLAGMPGLTQRRRYLKLRYGLYSSSHSVYLRRPKEDNYFAINKSDDCVWTGDEKHFPNLVRWIQDLPFASIGRILFFINEHLCPVVAHSDLKSSQQSKGYVANHPHGYEFIWIRPTVEEGKNFYILDEATGVKHYVKGRSCWFNSFDIHGADPSPTMTYSLRVDGRFTPEFKRKLGIA